MKGVSMCSLRMSSAVFLAGVFLCVVTAVAQQPKESKKSVVMEKKLEYSQGLLKALVTGDFDLADRNMNLMKTFTRLEEFYNNKRPEYGVELKKFQAANNDLSQAVERKDLDEAARAYGRLTQSCINCHQVLRSGER